jgi:hypothetical protein
MFAVVVLGAKYGELHRRTKPLLIIIIDRMLYLLLGVFSVHECTYLPYCISEWLEGDSSSDSVKKKSFLDRVLGNGFHTIPTGLSSAPRSEK